MRAPALQLVSWRDEARAIKDGARRVVMAWTRESYLEWIRDQVENRHSNGLYLITKEPKLPIHPNKLPLISSSFFSTRSMCPPAEVATEIRQRVVSDKADTAEVIDYHSIVHEKTNVAELPKKARRQ